MPMNPGHDQATFTSPAVVVDRLHKFSNPTSETSFNQGGCFLQPISVDEKITDTVYTDATARLLTPYNTDTLTVKAEWHVTVGSQTFRILGVKPHRDNFGRGIHLTFICKDQT